MKHGTEVEGAYTDSEIERLMQGANERAHDGRLERLRFLLSAEDENSVVADALAYEYYQEARLCWYVGAFVAAIVMSQLALEEILRSHYRVAKGVGGYLSKKKKVDRAGFFDLIRQAQDDGWISDEEAKVLNKMRKRYRNPYVHPHDFNSTNDFSKPNFLGQLMKIVVPTLLGRGVEDEAKETIEVLVTLFPRLSRRLLGLRQSHCDAR